MFILSGLIIVLNSFHKNYHVLSLSVSVLFFIIYRSKLILNFKIFQLLFIPLFMHVYILELNQTSPYLIKRLNCLNNSFCENSFKTNI